MKDRRTFIMLGTGGVMALFGLRWFGGNGEAAAEAKKTFEIDKPDAEWRKQLSAAQYDVLRGHGTERPGSSPRTQNRPCSSDLAKRSPPSPSVTSSALTVTPATGAPAASTVRPASVDSGSSSSLIDPPGASPDAVPGT